MPTATETPLQQAPVRQDQGVEQLKIANYYLRLALDQVQEGLVIFETSPLDATGPKVIFSNAPAACLMGADPAKGLRGLHLVDLMASEGDTQKALAALKRATEGGSADCECHLNTFYDSPSKPCRWMVRAVFNSMKRLLNFTVTVAPISVIQSAESAAPAAASKNDDLDAQSERLRMENLAALAKGIAHDVNNLLGPIAARLSEIIPNLPPESPLAKELALAFAGLKRAKQFTSQVVKASKAKPGQCEPADIGMLIRDTVQLSQAGSNVSVRLHAPEDLDWAIVDPVKMSQVLQNLIMNGIQAMPNGGYMDVEAKGLNIAPGKDMILKPGRYVEIVVRDRGTGIAPENLERLFHEVFTTKANGNGIGLTTCKRIIDEHGGDIQVSSKLNVGTEFRVRLPAIPRPQNAPKQTKSEAMAAPIPLQRGTGTVLIVDDEDELRRIAGSILHKCGYRVFDCDNGQEAMDTYRRLARLNETPDVVLMDLTLKGGMSGTETMHEILRFDPNARIIVTSGSVNEDVQVAFLEQGFVDVLAKPYEAGELSQKVYKIVNMRPSQPVSA